MKNRLVRIVTILTIMLVLVLALAWGRQDQSAPTPSLPPTSTPQPTPKTFKFNNSHDLKKELETVDPQVSESDFEEL